MTEPKVSIIMPFYNVHDYLPHGVVSILNQTYRNFELILVDDGSDDGSGQVADQLAHQDARIQVYHHENKGVADARNTGLDATTGDLITFVDADDMITPFYLANSVPTLLNEQADIVTTRCVEVGNYQEANLVLNRPVQKQSFTIVDGYRATEKLLLQDNIDVSCWGKIYRRELFHDLRFKSGIIYEDFEIVPKIFLKAKKVILRQETDYVYLERESSIMHMHFNENELIMLDITAAIFERMSNINIRLTEAAAAKNFYALSQLLAELFKLTPPRLDLIDQIWSAMQHYANYITQTGRAMASIKEASLIARHSTPQQYQDYLKESGQDKGLLRDSQRMLNHHNLSE